MLNELNICKRWDNDELPIIIQSKENVEEKLNNQQNEFPDDIKQLFGLGGNKNEKKQI